MVNRPRGRSVCGATWHADLKGAHINELEAVALTKNIALYYSGRPYSGIFALRSGPWFEKFSLRAHFSGRITPCMLATTSSTRVEVLFPGPQSHARARARCLVPPAQYH